MARIAPAFLLSTSLAGLLAATAGADVLQVYWTVPSGHAIVRVNSDGAGMGTVVVSPNGDPMGVAFDEASGSMYWVTSYINGLDRVYKCPIDGGGPADVVAVVTEVNGLGSDIELDLDAGKLYWCAWSGQSPNGGGIYRCNLDGSGQEPIVTGLDRPTRMVLDPEGDQVYWTDSGTWLIQRASTLGLNLAVTTLIPNPISPEGLAIDLESGYAYWSEFNTGTIKRASLGGLGLDTVVLVDDLDGASPPRDLAVDFVAEEMYWTDPVHAKIRKANLDGSGIVSLYGPASACVGIALRLAPPPAACPADTTGDGAVDAADLAGLLGAWGTVGRSPFDLTGDRVVDAADLASLLGAWGSCE